MSWLLRSDVAQELQVQLRSGARPTADQRVEFASRALGTGGAPRNLKIAGDVAEIRVEGLLTARPAFFAMFFGFANTTYSDIASALAIAGNDPSVRRVSLYVDSPGGTVAGLFDALAAFESFKKPISVLAEQACSAAYWIAASAGPITAKSPASSFGSIGVAASIFVDEDVVDIASTAAPNKRPDVTTAEGKAAVRAELDAIHDLFASGVAKGRRTTVANVNANFGKGGVLLAGEALKRGMIDRAPASSGATKLQSAGNAASSGTTKAKRMDLETLKANHPDVYAAAKKDGRAEEHSRMKAHLKLGRTCGDINFAIKAVEDGTELTPDMQAEYMSIALNTQRQRDRQADSDAAGRVTDGIGGGGGQNGDEPLDNGDLVARALNLPMPTRARREHDLR